jgi:hypothetical protein
LIERRAEMIKKIIKRFSFLVVLILVLASCAVQQRSPMVEVPSAPQLSEQKMQIRAGDPRYSPVSGWYKTYQLVVFNGSAHPIRLDFSANRSVDIGPAQRVDIPFEKDIYVWRIVPITWRFFRITKSGRTNQVVGTDSDIFRIPPDTERYAGTYGEVWHIMKGRPLKRMKLRR